MPTKNVAVQVKATGPADDTSLEEGQFVALASVFNNVDAVGDMVLPGAFKDDLKAWKSAGDTIPLYWCHRMDDPSMCIGGVIDAAETDTGLQVKAALDLDNPVASQVYKLLKGRRVNRMSFAYDVIDGGGAEKDGQHFYELRKLKLHEVSVVQVPANPEATIQTVKAGEAQSRTVSADVTWAMVPATTSTTASVMPVPGVITSAAMNLTRPQIGVGRTRKALVKAVTEDAALAGLVGQADQAIDDASAAIEQADTAMDAIMAYLGITDLPDEDEAEAGDSTAGGSGAGKAHRPASKGAIRSHQTSTSDAPWSGPKNRANLNNDDGGDIYKQAHAWVDPNADADAKSSYKFIHHEVSSDGDVGAANMAGATAGIAVLNGGRGGADIPATDRQGVYNHLAKHIKDGGGDPPDLAKQAGGPSTKAGRTLSAKNEAALRAALTKISAGVKDVKSVLAALDGTTEDGNDGKASPGQPATTEEPDGAKVDEPARPRPASIRLRADLAALAADVSLTE